MVKLPQDFKEFLDLLNARDVRYLVVGGYAVTLYGYPRHTGDIDIWVEREPENAERIAGAIREFGFEDPKVQASSFLIENYIAQMGVEPMRIEIFTHIPGVTFEETYKRRNIVNCEGTSVPFISLDGLLASKKASARPKDLSDLEELRSRSQTKG